MSINREKVMQTVIGPGGNCMSACLATLLQIPIESVPNFHDGNPSTDEWWARVRHFLRGHGFGILTVQPPEHFGDLCGLLLVAGVSPRMRFHSVIYFNGRLWHDPHPEGGGIDKVEQVDLLYPLYPKSVAGK